MIDDDDFDGHSWLLVGGISAGILALVCAITLVGWLLRPIEARIDREVAVESHQYQEARNEAIINAQQEIARLNSEIAKTDDTEVKDSLEQQKKVLENRIERERAKLR